MSADDAAADRWVVRALVASQFAPAFLFSGVAVVLPAMRDELGMTALESSLVETTFLVSGTAFLLPAGKLADATGRRTLLRWAMLAFAISALAIGAASSVWLVLVLRFVQGTLSAVCSAAAPAVLAELVPPQRRGAVFGAMIGVAYSGLATGPLCAGVIAEHFGWRAVFWLGAAMIVAGTVPVWLSLRPMWRAPGRWVHPPSLVLLVGGIIAVVGAASALEHPFIAIALAVVGAVALTWFVRWQPRLSDPLLDLRDLARDVVLRSALLVQLLLYVNAYCTVLLLSQFLQGPGELSAKQAGLVLAAGSLAMTLVAPLAGRLADRVRPQRVTAIGAAAVVLSSLGGLQLHAGSHWGHVLAVLLVQSVGFGLFSSPNMSVIVNALPRERAGVASALAAQSRGIGMVLGMAITGGILASWFGRDSMREHPDRVAGALHTAYTVLIVTSSAAVLFALRDRKRRD